MAIRDRLKRIVSRDSSTSSTSLQSPKPKPIIKIKTKSRTFGRSRKDSIPGTPANAENPDPNHVMYGPNEKLPLPKYRRPVAKEHRENLESFTWAKSWRRRSILSEYSPNHSRASSRQGSRQDEGRPSFGLSRKSFQKGRGPLAGSIVDEPVGEDPVAEAEATSGVKGTHLQVPGRQREHFGDSLVEGMEATHIEDVETPLVVEDSHGSHSSRTTLTPEEEREARKTLRTPQREAPFCAEELALALKRSQLAVA